jgi:hypothetical protein
MQPDAAVQRESVAVLVAISVQEAWARLEDFSLAHYYVPRLTRTEIVSKRRNGEGAHRRVYSGKRFLEETITLWRPGAGFVIALHQGQKPMRPFREAEFEYAISEASPQQTRVRLEMRIVMPGGAPGRYLARKLILPVIRNNLVQVAAGIKHFYETGEPAADADRKRLAEAVDVTSAAA